MAVTFVLRGRFKADRASAAQILNQHAMAMKEAAIRAGDLHHVLYFSAKDPSECVIIDTWQSSDQLYEFY